MTREQIEIKEITFFLSFSYFNISKIYNFLPYKSDYLNRNILKLFYKTDYRHQNTEIKSNEWIWCAFLD